MVNKKRKIAPSKARYLEKEPIISFHVPAPIKKALMQQSTESSLSLAQLLLKMVTGEVSAQNLRERTIKNIMDEGKIEGRTVGYRECIAAHEEIENCHCKSCVENKFAYWNLKNKFDTKR